MISGSALVTLLITLVIAGLIFWLLFWFIGFVGLPEPFAKVAKVIIALVAVVFLINAMLGIGGHPLIAWR